LNFLICCSHLCTCSNCAFLQCSDIMCTRF
jgi:hypothetical protein